MEIILAESSGFCIGVRMAVQRAEEVAGGPETVYSLGPLIHNPQEVTRLAGEGIRVAGDPAEVPGGTVVIRAHGAPPQVYQALDERGLAVVDATCPFVFSLQKKAMALADAGYQPVIIGDPSHPEVIGVVGWTRGRAIVISGEEDVERLPALDRVGVVAQTTQREDKVAALVAKLREKAREVRVEQTICRATTERQEAALALARQVPVMIVVGGTTSSNTQKLASICRDVGAATYHIETPGELDPGWLRGVDRVGVTAGASTPDWIVKEVIERMENLVEIEDGARTEETPVEAPAGAAVEAPAGGLQPGDEVEGSIVQVASDYLLIDVGYKSEGVAPRGELRLRRGQAPEEAYSVGQKIPVLVHAIDEEGTLRLSHRRASYKEVWSRLERAFAEGEEIEAPVQAVVKGGLSVDLGVRGFLPASQVELNHVDDLTAYVGQTIRARIIEFNPERKNVVLSRKAVLMKEARRRREQILAELTEGQVYSGVVKSLTTYGAFIDLGGVDGLLHVSEMAWNRVKQPADMLATGDQVSVKILRVDREQGKISLGLKQLQPDPWEGVAGKFTPDSTSNGRVTRVDPTHGAFVELAPGVEGLIHVSQLADHYVADPHEVVAEGDWVSVRILRVNPEQRRISLSMRSEAPVPAVRERDGRPNRSEQGGDRGVRGVRGVRGARGARGGGGARGARGGRDGRDGRGGRGGRGGDLARDERPTHASAGETRAVTLGDVFGDLLEGHREKLKGNGE